MDPRQITLTFHKYKAYLNLLTNIKHKAEYMYYEI